MKRFIFFYVNKNNPNKTREVAPKHVSYWHGLTLPDYMGGPFVDRSGGLIIFGAESLEVATSIMQNDPFVTEDLLEQQWLKEWIVE